MQIAKPDTGAIQIAEQRRDAGAIDLRVISEDQFAAVGRDQMQQKAGEGGFAAAAFADDAQRFSLEQGERHAVDGAHGCADRAALDLEMLLQIAGDQQRLCRSAAVEADAVHVHILTSMAERMPSLTRLKLMEVMKIAAPGSAQISGFT